MKKYACLFDIVLMKENNTELETVKKKLFATVKYWLVGWHVCKNEMKYIENRRTKFQLFIHILFAF